MKLKLWEKTCPDKGYGGIDLPFCGGKLLLKKYKDGRKIWHCQKCGFKAGEKLRKFVQQWNGGEFQLTERGEEIAKNLSDLHSAVSKVITSKRN
jgi:ribosomal protein L37AE/L43A